MADKRPAGRPKVKHPRDVRVTVRLNEGEVDRLYRIGGSQRTLSEIVRQAITIYLASNSQGTLRLPDNERARLQRNLRQARRAQRLAQPELEAVVGEAISNVEEELQNTSGGSGEGHNTRRTKGFSSTSMSSRMHST